MRMRITLFSVTIFMLGLVFMASNLPTGLAQDASCSAVVQSAFEQLNTGCTGAPGSSACFGKGASATFASESANAFSSPGDQVQLADIQSIQTLPVSPSDNIWGLALLNVHANVPLALSEQGLRYFMVGDVVVENAVDSASAFTPVSSLTVVPLVAANLRSAPSTDARVLASAPVGTELAADGLSADAQWLRVMSGDQMAWISRQVVSAQEGDIETLPQIGANTRTLMQAFSLTTGNEAPSCTDVPPSMLVIQAPDGVTANIMVNGVEIRFEGTIVLHVSTDNVMQFVVLSGAGNADGITVPAGFTLYIPTNPDGGSAGNATGLRPINDDERGFLSPVAAGISSDLLYSTLNIPTQEDINAIMAQINGASAAQVVSGPASGEADCSRFKPTSPLGGMPLGVTPFYWDGASGATTYRINMFNGDGVLISSIDTGSATSTTFQIDTSGFGDGSSFAWNVEALVDGQVACSSGRVSVIRDATSQTVGNTGGGSQPKPTKCSWSGC